MPTPTSRSPLTAKIPRTIAVSYGGSRDRFIGPFELAEGVVVVKATHSGEENFNLLLFGEAGGEHLLVDTVGAYAGVRGVSVHSGNQTGLIPGAHRLEVRADGPWTISIGQEFPVPETVAEIPPFKFVEQQGDDVKRWVRFFTGEFVIRASHTGEGDFTVGLVNADGGTEVLVVDQSGVFEGERLLRVGSNSSDTDLLPGFYVLVVQADGGWEVEFLP